jgi:hypothetical protein
MKGTLKQSRRCSRRSEKRRELVTLKVAGEQMRREYAFRQRRASACDDGGVELSLSEKAQR